MPFELCQYRFWCVCVIVLDIYTLAASVKLSFNTFIPLPVSFFALLTLILIQPWLLILSSLRGFLIVSDRSLVCLLHCPFERSLA